MMLITEDKRPTILHEDEQTVLELWFSHLIWTVCQREPRGADLEIVATAYQEHHQIPFPRQHHTVTDQNTTQLLTNDSLRNTTKYYKR